MSSRQILNRNSYVVVAGLIVVAAASFVARDPGLFSWAVWILVVLALYGGFLLLRPGTGSKITMAELEHLVGAGTPVVLHLFSNY